MNNNRIDPSTFTEIVYEAPEVNLIAGYVGDVIKRDSVGYILVNGEIVDIFEYDDVSRQRAYREYCGRKGVIGWQDMPYFLNELLKKHAILYAQEMQENQHERTA